MTGTSDGSHIDPDQLADLQEGLLDGPDETAVRAHLEGCARCQADLTALAGVRDSLAGAAAVGPVPDDVVHRIDRVLAAVATEPAGSATTRTVTPLRAPERSGPRGMRVLQAAAVLVLLLAGGAIGVSALHRGTASNSSAGSSAGADNAAPKAAEGSFPLTVSGRDWTSATLAAAAPQLAAGTFGPSYSAAEPPSPDASASGGDTAHRLADAPAARLAGGPALAACVGQLVDGPMTPLAVDLASFNHAPAAVILLPTAGDAKTMDLYVVKPECPPGEFLYFARVPRP